MTVRYGHINIEKLREQRIIQGRTQTFMAKELGYKTTSGYANIESGKRNLSFSNAIKISEIMSIDIKELFFD